MSNSTPPLPPNNWSDPIQDSLDEAINDLHGKLQELNISLEKQSWALHLDLMEVLKWNISFPELVCSYSGIQQLGYQNGEYGFFDEEETNPTLTGAQRTRLMHARITLFDKLTLIEKKWISPSKECLYSESCEIYTFFNQELTKLRQKFPESYSIEEYWKYIEYHLPDAMFDKLQDSTRFVRFAKDNSGEVVAYFESRQNPKLPNIQIVQWFFTDKSVRRNGEIRRFWNEFITWCQERWYSSVWSYTALRNDVSKKVHSVLMPDATIEIHDPHTLVYVQPVPQKITE